MKIEVLTLNNYNNQEESKEEEEPAQNESSIPTEKMQKQELNGGYDVEPQGNDMEVPKASNSTLTPSPGSPEQIETK